MMIGDDRWSMMKTVAVKLERWLSTARQGYVPLIDSEDMPKPLKPVRNRRAIAFSYPSVKPPGSFTMEILPKVDGSRGRRARLRQKIEAEDDTVGDNVIRCAETKKENIPVKNINREMVKSQKNYEKADKKNLLAQRLSTLRNSNIPDRLSLPKNNATQLSTPKKTFSHGRRAVLKQELTPTGELYSYTTPHKCYICGKTCYLPFTYQPFIRMNNNYIEVTQYYYDDNANVVDEEDVVTVINAEREYRYRKDLNPRRDNRADSPIIVLAFDSEIRSSKI